MSESDYSLSAKFEIAGVWWLPESPTTRLPGILKYSGDDMRLELQGSLAEIPLQELFTVGSGFQRFPVVHGETTNGKHYTLLKCNEVSKNHSFAATTSTALSAIYLVVGAHTPRLEQCRAVSTSFGCTRLEEFLSQRWWSYEQTPPATEFLIRSGLIDPIHNRVDALEGNVVFHTFVSISRSHTNVSLDAHSSIEIEHDAPQNIERIIEIIWQFCDLLRLLTDVPVRPTEMQLRLEGEHQHDCWLLYRGSGASVEQDSDYWSVLFSLADIQSILPALFEAWFGMERPLRTAVHLFRNAHRRQDQLDNRFLMATKAAEVFSRAVCPPRYVTPEEYRVIESALIAALPTSLTKEHRQNLKSRIQYGNELSFKSRITNLISQLSPDTQCILCKNVNDFAKGIKDARNYLTHFGHEGKGEPLTGGDLYWACEKVLLLLRVQFLKYVGLDEAVIRERLISDPRLSQIIHLWKGHPEVRRQTSPATITSDAST